MAMTAYDLTAVRQAEPVMPRVQVVRGGRYGLRKTRAFMQRTMRLAVAALLLGMIVGVVHSQAQITSLSVQIDKTGQELLTAQSTYDYLSDTMSAITSSANVQQIAEGRLGLIRADASQITYIHLEDESVVARSASSATLLLDGFRTAALSLIGTLDP